MCFSVSTNLGLKIILCVHSQHLQIPVDRYRPGLVSECASKNVSLVLRTTHTHTHTHAHAAVSLAVLLIILRTQPHTRASQCSGHYMDCLACGDLSVWDSTILSRQGENTYFGCFSQHQKRPPITLNWDVLKKKKKFKFQKRLWLEWSEGRPGIPRAGRAPSFSRALGLARQGAAGCLQSLPQHRCYLWKSLLLASDERSFPCWVGEWAWLSKKDGGKGKARWL